MADYTAKQIDEMEAAFGGGMKKARAELGVASFGMQVIDLPPNYSDYPEHDHASDGQEEVYSAMRGSARSTSKASASRSRPTCWCAWGRRRSARSMRAPKACACWRWGERRARPTKRPNSANWAPRNHWAGGRSGCRDRASGHPPRPDDCD